METIYPVHDPVALQDKRVYGLIQYAMKVSCPFKHGWFILPPLTLPPYSSIILFQVEKAMFDTASNREDYYKLLAQKMYHIRKELDDRKKAREGKN